MAMRPARPALPDLRHDARAVVEPAGVCVEGARFDLDIQLGNNGVPPAFTALEILDGIAHQFARGREASGSQVS